MIPLHLSGAVIACIFALMACVAVAILWVMCVIVDEWRDAGGSDYLARRHTEQWSGFQITGAWIPNTTGQCPWPDGAKIDVIAEKHEAYNMTNDLFLLSCGHPDAWKPGGPYSVKLSRLSDCEHNRKMIEMAKVKAEDWE